MLLGLQHHLYTHLRMLCSLLSLPRLLLGLQHQRMGRPMPWPMGSSCTYVMCVCVCVFVQGNRCLNEVAGS